MTVLRTRKALALACKAFYGPATEVLYQDIVLHRMGQILAFARTLDRARTPSADDIAALVRSIRIDSCVVWAPFAAVVLDEIYFIIERCTALREFTFLPHANIKSFDDFHQGWLFNPDSTNPSVARPGLLYAPLAHGLSTMDLVIELTYDGDFLAFHAFLGSASRLKKLKIRVYGLGIVQPAAAAGPARPLLALQDFSYNGLTSNDWFFAYMTHAWALPQLRALTVIAMNVTGVGALLHTHGARLTYLHWRSHYFSYAPPYGELAALGTSCPRLEHLVIQHRQKRHWWPGLPALPTVCSRTLRFLDVWVVHNDPLRQDELPALMSRDSDAPRLERVRVLLTPFGDRAMYPATVDWPRLYHPLDTRSEEHKPWRVPTGRVGDTGRVVFFEDTQSSGLHGSPDRCNAAPELDTQSGLRVAGGVMKERTQRSSHLTNPSPSMWRSAKVRTPRKTEAPY